MWRLRCCDAVRRDNDDDDEMGRWGDRCGRRAWWSAASISGMSRGVLYTKMRKSGAGYLLAHSR